MKHRVPDAPPTDPHPDLHHFIATILLKTDILALQQQEILMHWFFAHEGLENIGHKKCNCAGNRQEAFFQRSCF